MKAAPLTAKERSELLQTLIPVLGDGWIDLLDRPPVEEVSLRTLFADRRQEILCEVVVASQAQREKNALLAKHPVHFKKTYLAGRRTKSDFLRETEETVMTPRDEMNATLLAKSILPDLCPTPLGYDTLTFRAEFIPGKDLNATSPFLFEEIGRPSVDKMDLKMAKMENPHYASAAWNALESLFNGVKKLHAAGYMHRDVHRGNMMMVETPKGFRPRLIDFECLKPISQLGRSGALTEQESAIVLNRDFGEILKEGALIQAAWGPQDSPLGEASRRVSRKLIPGLPAIPEPKERFSVPDYAGGSVRPSRRPR